MNDFSEKICLFIGRFQPFHTGHLMVVQGMAKSCAGVVIAVGSSQESDTKENPFSFEERREMIQRALQGKDLIPQFDITIVPVSDIPEDERWLDHVREKAGAFDVVWSGNAGVLALCRAKGVEVKEIKEVPGIDATDIRRMMMEDQAAWAEKVPREVAEYLKSIQGPERVRNLS
ncbi:nicotinamide-nucleotide adenylyltransferase [Candidatus Uhrbacteria bacterium]|nr:nicotinamide-nucleotide adenylyltransferase [Candidatus Uhrbacteria bacterium]